MSTLLLQFIRRLSLIITRISSQVKDYDATVDVELDAVEKFVLQCLAFYQVPRDVFFVDNPEVTWIKS